MKNQYTQQDITQFFEQFKKLPEYYDLKRIQQVINNPLPISMNSTLHGIKPLNLFIIATVTISVLVSIIIFSHLQNKTSKEKNELLTTQKIVNVNNTDNLNKVSKVINKKVIQPPAGNLSTSNLTAQITVSSDINSDTLINGEKYILELSFDELRNLGFDIRQHVVFYRNINPNAKCYFSSIMPDRVIIANVDNKPRDNNAPTIRNTYHLQRDTFPVNTDFYFDEVHGNPENRSINYVKHSFNSTMNDFYPLFTSSLDGQVNSLNPAANFNSQIDTLVPVVLRFSRLLCEQKKDLIFWFNPTDDFFHKLPEKYKWLKTDYYNLKALKLKNPAHDFVDYNLSDWVKQQLFPQDSRIDGSKFMVQLTNEELKKIGVSGTEKGSIDCYYCTPWGNGKGMGGQYKNIDGKPVIVHDNTFYVDFLWEYGTDKNGNSLSFHTTSKLIGKFLIDNDILLPVYIKESGKGMVLWFSLSDSLWSLLPQRYRYLKDEYDKIMFNKSFYPDKDIVIYFKNGLEKLDMNVKILELNKSELENLGFQFKDDNLSIECVYDQEWLQYKLRDGWITIPEPVKKKLGNSSGIQKERYLLASVNFINSGGKHGMAEAGLFSKFDSLVKCKNQGYHFLFITDSLGRQLDQIQTATKNKLKEQNQLNYLIPVMVKQSDYFRKYAENKIFWFTPTDEFFERLPLRIKSGIKSEFKNISIKGNTSNCTYFEECRTTLDLTNFKMYPNPATSWVTVEFNNPQKTSGTISLLNIVGSKLKMLLPKAEFSAGYNNYNLDLSGINPGIYLIYIQTEKGIKTQRLIISQ